MLTSLFVGFLLGVAGKGAWDWPQWRGPNRDAASATSRVPQPWPDTLTQRWRFPVGSGQSSPVVANATVFLFTRQGEMEVAWALDLRTGKTLWRQGYPAPYSVY